jgi:hypothetical protein
MNNLFPFASRVFIAVAMALLIPLAAGQAQFGIDKLKKSAEKAKETLNKTGVTSECEPLKKLQERLPRIRQSIADKDFTSAKIHISQAEMFENDAKTKCPGPELTAASGELAGYKEKFKAAQQGAETAASNQANDEDYISKARFAMYKLDEYSNVPWGGRYNIAARSNEFKNLCSELNYPATRKKLDEIMARNPELNKPQTSPRINYDDYIARYKKFTEFVDNALTRQVNLCIEEAYKLKSQGKNSMTRAAEQAEAAVIICQAALIMIPGHAGMQKLLKQAESASEKIGGQTASLYTSEFHKANAGKVVFSKSPVEIKQEIPSAMLNKFVGGDLIYGMIYTKSTWTEATKGDNNVLIHILIDGEKRAEHRFNMVREKRDMTYLTMEFVPDPMTMQTQGAIKYTKAFAELSPRPHTVKVQVWHETYDPIIAEGEFELDLTETLDKMEAAYKQMVNAKLSKVFMPKPAKADAALERAMIEATRDWPGTPLRAVITDADWTTHRNAISGAIEFRSIHGAVAFKLPEGNCKMFYLDFKEAYNGRTYGKLDDYAVGDSDELPCENVNK